MDVMALGFQKFETPFSTDAVILEYGIELEGLPKGICGGETNLIDTKTQNTIL
jgi:adenosylhomocysteine nucleosidase